MATSPSSTVLKAFSVLDLFYEHRQLGVKECSVLLGIPRPTAHRLLVSLTAAGAVEQTPTGSYRLSLRMFEIGSQSPFFRALHERAQPGMESLAAATGLNGHLGVRDGRDVVYILKVCGEGRIQTRLGIRNPLHATGLGKLLLAYSPAHVVEGVLSGNLERFTAHTITDPKRLLDQLLQARQTGLAHELEERQIGVGCAATGIRDRTGAVVAAISISAPVERYRHRLTSLHRPLRAAASAIEKRLNAGTLLPEAAN